MSKLYKIVAFLFFVFVAASFSADDELKILFTIKSTSDFFTTDNLGNTYLIKGEEIKKYSQTGDLLKIFSNKTTGKITSLDATNPLRMLVFYKDFATILIIDDLLSQNGDPMNLLDYSLEQSDAICTSFNNGIWFFNRENMELIRLDESFKPVVNSGNLNRLLGADFKPNFMIENNGYLYLNNPTDGIYVFDIYGTYFKTIPIKNLQRFQVKDNNIFYYLGGVLKSYNIKDLTQKELPFKNVTDVRVEKENYYLFYSDSVVVKYAD
ncbi:MAG TPA: hypothetical protein VNX01_16890 [Bacteroidia bacterium]|jgi:hypothetical protein|nr:hypothetical protein [Bacteroidia bacterium]